MNESMNQHGPCTGNDASCTGSEPGATVVAEPAGAVVAVDPCGRHSCIPGNSAVEVVAPLAVSSALMATDDFFAIWNHESPDTTVYIDVHDAGAAAGAEFGFAAGTAAGQAGRSSASDDAASTRRGDQRRRSTPRSRSLCDVEEPVPGGNGSAPVRSSMTIWYRPVATLA